MERPDNYIPRRARRGKRRHSLRRALLALLLLGCAAFAALRWGLPLWLDYVTPEAGASGGQEVDGTPRGSTPSWPRATARRRSSRA